jgi:hypothetical protein
MSKDGGSDSGGWLINGTTASGRAALPSHKATTTSACGHLGLPSLTTTVPGNQHGGETCDHTAFRRFLGRSGRNRLRGPGFHFDTSIQRMIKFAERYSATVRLDIFNMFNRSNFGLPDPNVVSATAGVISTLGGDPRIMQLSARFAF